MKLPCMKEMPYHFGLKVRIYPSTGQKRVISRNFGAARFVYNRMVAMNNELYRLRHDPGISLCPALMERKAYLGSLIAGIHKSTTAGFCSIAPFLGEDDIDSDCVSNAYLHYQAAWNNFKKVPSAGTPKFHRKGVNESYTMSCHYPKAAENGNDGSIRMLDVDHLQLPKLGRVRFAGSPLYVEFVQCYIDSFMRIGSAAVTVDAKGRYFISLSIGSMIDPWERYPETGADCGIDVNLTNFCTDSDGVVTENPHLRRSQEPRLAMLQRKQSRRYEQAKRDGKPLRDAKNYQKARKQTAVLNGRIAARRHEFQEVLAAHYVKSHDIVYAEDLRIKNMMKAHTLAKSVADVGWGGFTAALERKCREHGKFFLKVPAKDTTQTCSVCGHVMSGNDAIKLGEEEWTCPVCHTHHGRDGNSAINIRNKGREMITA